MNDLWMRERRTHWRKNREGYAVGVDSVPLNVKVQEKEAHEYAV